MRNIEQRNISNTRSFQDGLSIPTPSPGNRHFGDFQTPPELVAAVISCVKHERRNWSRALEPTCGSGQFIHGLINGELNIREIHGIELQDSHFANTQKLANANRNISVRQGSLFDIDLRKELHWKEDGPLLVIGNPPWVTNSELSALGRGNLPEKSNFKGLRGLDALTGESNFDIAEYIWLKLIKELADQRPTIALLCKTSVARTVLKYAARAELPISDAQIRRIEAKKWFGAAVDACLFIVEVGQFTTNYDALVYESLTASNPERVIGVRDGELIADIQKYNSIFMVGSGLSLTWRQGVKHDAAVVMELFCDDEGKLQNKLGETVDVEPQYVYPLMKSSDLFKGNECPRRFVIITQKSLRDDTSKLERDAPKLWDYLNDHSDYLEQRGSSIYKSAPKFSIFGIGDYSFAEYKVAISGMYKTPRFQCVKPFDGRPVMFDDTCYFTACRSGEEARALADLLNSPDSLNQIQSMIFTDAKRPITKKLLQRLNTPAPTQDKLPLSDEPT